MLKKIIVCLCSLVLVFSLAGCSTKSSAAEKSAISQPVVNADVPKKELITVSKLTSRFQDSTAAYQVMGTVTNNNKMGVHVILKVVYTNADGTPLRNEDVVTGTIDPGGTESFDYLTTTDDLKTATYKIQIEDFVHTAEDTW
jgi:hypothetical protein